MTAPARRVLFYCHNVFGLGHIVRSLRIAEACVREQGLTCTVVTGCRSLDEIARPGGVALERLPPVRRAPDGSLAFNLQDVAILRERAARIAELVREWRPDVLVVDGNPFGLGGELLDALSFIRRHALPTRVIWGVPYVEAAAVRSPLNHRLQAAFETFDVAMAYTDPAIEQLFDALPYLPPLSVYTGVIAEPLRLDEHPGDALVVGLCGGGTSGGAMFELFRDAIERLPEVRGRFIAGPLGHTPVIPSEVEGSHTVARPGRIEIRRTASLEEAVHDAAVVVTRAGYNTAWALAATPLPLVLLPLPIATSDQRARAARLRRADGVFVIDERSPSAASDLACAIAAALARGRAPRELAMRFDGASRAAAWIAA